jgi:hypothetical protein
MLPTELDYLVRQEQRQDQLRTIEKEQLIKLMMRNKENERDVHRLAAAWLGDQLVKWGSTLQRYASTSKGTVVRAQ